MDISRKITLPIGNTPIINVYDSIYLKLEQFNIGGSIKSRVAFGMINSLICENEIDNNTTILEASGGNTGIGLAILSKYFNYNLILSIPDNYSQKKINLLLSMGVDVRLSDHTKGNDSHLLLAREILDKNPDFIYTDQLSNIANIEAHYQTGDEIIEKGIDIDFFVAGIGSGGTITGIGQQLNKYNKNIKIIGVVPAGYSIKDKNFIPHNIQGIGIGKIPKILDLNIIDDYIEVSELELISMGKKLMNDYGLFLGLSSLANMVAALKILSKFKNKNIVTISPDAGYDYSDYYSKHIFSSSGNGKMALGGGSFYE